MPVVPSGLDANADARATRTVGDPETGNRAYALLSGLLR